MHKDNALMADAFIVCYANDFGTDNRAYVPEVWAQESLMVLEENMVMANLVHRDFENEIASEGDVVNTRRPGEFEMKRKTAADEITVQDASATKVQVKLDQHLHTSFMIKDEELSKSMKDLVTEFLTPAVRSIARGVDQILLGQTYQFMTNGVGKLGTDLAKATVIAANTKMNQNKVPVGPGMRNMILTPGQEGALLNVADFTKVNESGTSQALIDAQLGRKFGFDFYMCQNAPSVGAQTASSTAAVNLSAGYAAGATTIAMDGTSDTILPGTWFVVAGDNTPQVVVTATGSPTTSITCSPGLRNAVVNDAVITFYPVGAVNLSAGYASGYTKTLAVDGLTAAPEAGQLMSINSAANRKDYALINTPTTTAVDLDRALDSAVTNDTIVGLGPTGDYGFAFHRNALALVSRPLAIAPQGMGATQAVANYNGLSVRVSLAYDSYKQGMLVTVDTLLGTKVLDTNLGAVLFG